MPKNKALDVNVACVYKFVVSIQCWQTDYLMMFVLCCVNSIIILSDNIYTQGKYNHPGGISKIDGCSITFIELHVCLEKRDIDKMITLPTFKKWIVFTSPPKHFLKALLCACQVFRVPLISHVFYWIFRLQVVNDHCMSSKKHNIPAYTNYN